MRERGPLQWNEGTVLRLGVRETTHRFRHPARRISLAGRLYSPRSANHKGVANWQGMAFTGRRNFRGKTGL